MKQDKTTFLLALITLVEIELLNYNTSSEMQRKYSQKKKKKSNSDLAARPSVDLEYPLPRE